jgi:hypothetical protein
MSGIPHTYLGSADGLDPCLFEYSGSQRGFCGYIRNNGIHLDGDAMGVSPLDAPTERLDIGGSEGAVPRVREGARAGSREAGNELVDGGGRRISENPTWRVATAALLSDSGRVVSGPWPVRKYVLSDVDSAALVAERGLYQGLLDALYLVGVDYQTSVYRSFVDCPWRCVVVTWGWAVSLSLEAIADELALVYDRPSGAS